MAATATVGYQNTTDIVLDMTAVASGTPDVFDIVVTRAFQVMTQQKILIREGNQLKVLQFNIFKDIAEGRKESPKTSS